MWLGLSLFSGIGDGLARGIIKATRAHPLLLATAAVVFAFPLYAGALFLTGIPEIDPWFWGVVIAQSLLLTGANIAMVKAHQSSPLILTVPYLALTPAFLLITSPMLGGGVPGFIGALGVMLITIGLYVLNVNKKEVGFWGPFRAFWKETGSKLMLLVAIIYSITANLDKVAMGYSNLPFYLTTYAIFTAFFSAVLLAVVVPRQEIVKAITTRSVLLRLILFGLVIGSSVMLGIYALHFAIVPFVISMKRLGVALATIAGMLYFREKENLGTRLIGFAFMFGGASLITLFG